jgi:flavin-dependent dehydrogenase
MVSYEPVAGGYLLNLQSGTKQQQVFTRYLVAADGMYSKVRQKLRPDHFLQKAPGGAMNYYCTGEGDLDPHALYMVNIKAYAPIMFAWIYKKDDQWVIGTGAEYDLKDYADRFYEYVCREYDFKGEIVRREGFASPLKNGVFLGEDNILLCGDAAGLLDAYRGVAMDNAALSGRFAVKAILTAEKKGTTAIEDYRRRMRSMKRQMENNEKKRQVKFASDETLEASFAPRQVLIGGLKYMAANAVNRVLPAENVFTLPF